MKILIVDIVHPVMIDIFSKNGYNCYYNPDISRKEIYETIHQYQGLIIRSKIQLNKEVLDKALNLRFIGRVGAGMESIDLEYAQTKGIKCFNSPEGNKDAVGEQAVGMLLSLFNKLCKVNQEVRSGKWEREQNRGLEISGKTIGIIGYGNMGSAFAQRLYGFNARVLAYDKYKFNFSNPFVTEVDLHDIFEQTDILSLHLPLTDETQFMFDDKFINSFHKNFWLINTARGKIVRTDDLVANLEQGKILGACLDVLEYENISFNGLHINNLPKSMQYLINSDKVILSPHIAGLTEESKYKLSAILAEKICRAML